MAISSSGTPASSRACQWSCENQNSLTSLHGAASATGRKFSSPRCSSPIAANICASGGMLFSKSRFRSLRSAADSGQRGSVPQRIEIHGDTSSAQTAPKSVVRPLAPSSIRRSAAASAISGSLSRQASPRRFISVSTAISDGCISLSDLTLGFGLRVVTSPVESIQAVMLFRVASSSSRSRGRILSRSSVISAGAALALWIFIRMLPDLTPSRLKRAWPRTSISSVEQRAGKVLGSRQRQIPMRCSAADQISPRSNPDRQLRDAFRSPARPVSPASTASRKAKQ